MRYSLFLSCLLWVALCLVLSSVTGWISARHIHDWYHALQQPPFNPPQWIFAPVWTLLYVTIGIAGGLLFAERKKHNTLFIAFLAQLVFNFSWSFIFFMGESPGWALVDIVALWCSVLIIMILGFVQKNCIFWLLAPYFLWVSFAALLNYFIWQLN